MQHVELSNIVFGYRDKPLFDDLSLTITPQSMTALVGPNGSGKSSLLRIIAGLQRATYGEVRLMGQALNHFSAPELAKTRAFMPQHTITPEAMTVRQLVQCGRYAYQGWFASPSAEDAAAVDWAMDACGVTRFKDIQVDALSGGERQRAWLASALSQKAPILIFDEPCSYLDIRHQIDLMRVLRDLVDNDGLTVILSLHDIAQAAQYADQVVALSNGQVESSGEVDQVLSAELVESVFGVSAEFYTSNLTGKRHCIFHAADHQASNSPAK